MLVTERNRQEQHVRALAEQYGRERSSLMPILEEIQSAYHVLDEHIMQVIAHELDLHPVEVYSVVSFYSFLKDKPTGKFVIRLCRTISCDLAGKDRVARQLENDLGIKFGETTPDGMFTLEWANCMGMCDQGPALLVNDKVYTAVTPDRVPEILEECRSQFGLHAVQKEH